MTGDFIIHGKDVRIYVVDVPNFLSCGDVYVTNSSNRIIVTPNADGLVGLEGRKDEPFTLAQYPIPEKYFGWTDFLKVGTKVFPSGISANSIGPENNLVVPTIVDTLQLTTTQLYEYMETYNTRLNSYLHELSNDLRVLDNSFEVVKQVFADRREDIKKHHGKPTSLIQIIKQV
nr:hypothetical protein [Nanoarchaeum sp.]